jgi:hypothetical protein
MGDIRFDRSAAVTGLSMGDSGIAAQWQVGRAGWRHMQQVDSGPPRANGPRGGHADTLALLSIDHGRDDGPQTFHIRSAQAETQRQAARQLVRRMYSHRGYLTPCADEPVNRNSVTLVVAREEEPVGTLTVGFDSHAGLLCDELFKLEVDDVRRSGRKVCEFTKLALDMDSHSKQVLASLFHMAYLHAHRIRGCDDVLIEVNPRHVSYYERMLDFRVVGEEKLCPRVNAPAVLMALDLAHTRRQIERYAGRFEVLAIQRSLYPYAFVPEQEREVLRALFGSAPSSPPI